METTRIEAQANPPRRRRYRLNKRKFAAALLTFVFIAAIVAVAAVSLANAVDVHAVVINDDMPQSVDTVSHTAQVRPYETADMSGADSMSGRLIVLDAGHGGFDPGAIGVAGTHEADLNLAVAKYLETELEGRGAEVIMTRTDDDAVADNKDDDMAERRRIIEQSGSDIVISIHMNFFEDDPQICGPVALFMPGSVEGKRLAEVVQKSLNNVMDASGIARSESLYILKSGHQPCVLVECGYLSNEEEERSLSRPDYQQRAAKAICDGIEEYFCGHASN